MTSISKIDNEILNLHSGAIQVENKLSLKARLCWFNMVYKAIPNMKSQEVFTVTIGEIKNLIDYKNTNSKDFKKILEELRDTTIEWNIFEKNEPSWGWDHLLSGCRVRLNSNVIEYSFSPFLKEKLVNPEMYAKINLLISRNFKSKHSLSIYCLALDYLQIKNNYGEKTFSVEQLRKYLGLENNELKKTGDLYIWVIQKAVSDINKNSDINISVETKRGERNKIISFKFKMSIKDEFLDNYKPQKAPKPNTYREQTKTNKVYSLLEIDTDTKKIELEKIRISNDLLKKFIAENNISMSTKVVQEQLRVIKQSFNDKFEDYLIFLMNYTKEELKKTSIKNVSGFFVSLIKDEDQLQNYIIYFQEKEIEKHKKQSKLKDLLENELNGSYKSFLSSDFINYLVDNASKLEKDIVNILKSNLKTGDFFYDVVLPKHGNIIDKTLLTDDTKGTRYFVTTYLSDYKKELNYVPWTFEEWKKKKVTEKDLRSLEAKLERSI